MGVAFVHRARYRLRLLSRGQELVPVMLVVLLHNQDEKRRFESVFAPVLEVSNN